MKKIRFLSLVTLFLIISFVACSVYTADSAKNIKLPAIFTDNMVLQQKAKVPVWGTGEPGGKVIVQFDDKTKKAVVSKDSCWQVNLPSFTAGGPLELSIIGQDTITFKNVMVGEVWVCSGQSNMQWSVRHAKDPEMEISKANYPNIRLFQVHQTMSTFPKSTLACDPWEECNPSTIPDFSAVSYFFGRALYKNFDVPIGLIHTSWVARWQRRGLVEHH